MTRFNAAFWRWFGRSQVVNPDGSPRVMYHGSPEGDITEFAAGRTAYGVFFSRDPGTAEYYTGGRGKVYAVYLKAENVADLDDEVTFARIAEEAIWDMEERRQNQEGIADFAQQVYEQGYGKFDFVTKFFDSPEFTEVDKSNIKGSIKELAREYDFFDRFEEWVQSVKAQAPKLWANFDEQFPVESNALKEAREAYGSQEFYMQYQNDFMHAAENLGYDGVEFSDPSSAGESTSFVVFSPEQIKSIHNRGAWSAHDPNVLRNPWR